MKHFTKSFIVLSAMLIVLLVPERSLAQRSNIQDNPKQQEDVRFNNKKLMKMQNPGLKISDKIDNPFLRAEYERARLVDPRTGTVPPNIKQLEMEFALSPGSGLSRPALDLDGIMAAGDISSPWISRGPFNVGGRTRAIAIDRTDENILFAGGVSGGLWRSTDQGATWTKITPAQEHPGITDIEQDPRAGFENVWYYSTGERIGNSASDGGAFFAGNGIYKSTDGGLTFSVLPATENLTPESFSSNDPFDLIFGIEINPLNGDLYVATYVGVHRSTDGGATFEEVINAPFDNESDVHITSTGVIYATVASDAVDPGILRSETGAPGSFVNITPGGFPATFNRTVIHTAPSNEDVLYLLSVTPGGGTLGMSFWKYTYLSGDGSGAGGSWEDRSSNIPALGGSVGNFNPQGGYNLVVRVHPLDEELVFIGGTNIYRSFDGFATAIGDDNWIGGYAVTNNVSLYTNHHPDQHGMEFFPSNPDKVYSSHDGGVAITNDIQAFDAGGPFGNESVTWIDLNNGYLTTQTYALSIGPGDQLQAGFQDQSTWFTNNTGSTNPWTVVAGADGSYNAFNSDGTLRYVSFQNGTTFRQEYTDADSDLPLTQDFITPNGASGFLFVNPYELDPNNDEIMYLAGGSTLWRNDNLPNATSTVGWAPLSNATIAGTVSAIGISTSPANVVYIGSTSGQVIRINDANTGNPAGIDVTGVDFPAGNVTSVDVSPYNADDVIVTFSNYSVISIWRSTDGGNSWTNISGNLEENPDGSGSGPSVRWVTRIGFNDRYFAGTSVGLYSTDELNGAATVWTQEDPNGIGNVVIEQIRKRDSDGLVVLGTHGNGLFSANFEVTPPPLLVANPVADVEVDINSADVILDVSNVFESTIDPPATLTLSVSNDNNTLLTTSLSGTDLTLSFAADEFGDAAVTLTADDGNGNQISDLFLVTVNPPPLIITEFPYLEDFENGADGPGSFPRDWQVRATPPYQWTVLSGATPTGGFNGATGPLVDHTTGTANGFYVYTEASGGIAGDTTELTTPPVVLSSLENPVFEFWYHLFGDDIVSFEVEVIDEVNETVSTVFTRNGPVQTAQTDPYQIQIVPLSTYGDTVRVRFRGIRGSVVTDGFLGDMAIDDVRFSEAPLELVTASPSALTEALEQGRTSTQTLTLTNISTEDVHYDLTLENSDGGIELSSATVPLYHGRTAGQKLEKRTTPFTGAAIDRTSTAAIVDNQSVLLAVEQYGSGFESFLLGDINGQDGWVGQFGNWVIDTSNPSEGSQHMRSVSDGLGQTLAFSPSVPIGIEPFSSVSARINIEGSGVTWELIPQSNTAAFVNTRLRFNPDGSVDALVSDGIGGGIFEPLGVSTPSGYFKVDIVVDRATLDFTILFDGEEVFSGLGFAGDIEQLVLLSAMEDVGSTFDMDELQILDGEVEQGVSFLSVDPVSGSIGAGTSVEIEVTFDATEQDFGTFNANIVANINGGEDEPVIVPATLTVFGPPSIAVDPTVIIEEVDFQTTSVRTLSLENTGGDVVDYSLSIIGATVEQAQTGLMMISDNDQLFDERVLEKKRLDDSMTKHGIAQENMPLMAVIGETILEESFEGGTFPPAGWNVIDNEGTGVVWQFAADYGDGNYTSTGEAATVNSDASGVAEFDTELWTPEIDVAGKSDLYVQYTANYQNLAGLDFLDLDISTDGGTSWVTLLSWNEDHGGFFAQPGELVTIPLDAAVAGASSMILRWRYYDPNTDDFDWYAQIDDVIVFEEAEMWLSIDQTAGQIPVGTTAEVPVIFDASLLEGGDFKVAGIIVNSNAVNTPEVGVVAAIDVREPAEADVSVEELNETLVENTTGNQSFTIGNSGESDLVFSFQDIFFNADPVTFAANMPEIETRNSFVASETGLRPTPVAITNASGGQELSISTNQYATDFEGFILDDITGQSDWFGQFGNWVADNSNPFGKAQHLRSVSDGLGQTLAFSPAVASSGLEPTSSTTMQVNIEGSGVTWDIIPQSNSAALVNTILRFNLDGSVAVLNTDTLGNVVFTTLPVATPSGYFKVGIEVDRATAVFSVSFDGIEVFAGQGFAGNIEQVVLRSFMEVPDPTFDMDNFQIIDGEIFDPFVTLAPTSGVLGSGESVDIDVFFDARNVEPGIYTEDLVLSTNDPDNEEIIIPATLEVLIQPTISVSPDAIEIVALKGDVTTTVVEVANLGQAELTFEANTDTDALLFTNGTTTLADAVAGLSSLAFDLNASYDTVGIFADTVTFASNDPDNPVVYLPVYATIYPEAGAVTSFNLIDAKADTAVGVLQDGDVIDANTDFPIFNVEALTFPGTVGSVVFEVDGEPFQTESFVPYAVAGDQGGNFRPFNIGAGVHTITATPYSEAGGAGDAGQALSVTFELINSDSITGFDLIDSKNDVSLGEFMDGMVIDLGTLNRFTVEAFASRDSVGSVVFVLNERVTKTDNRPRYSASGNNGDNFRHLNTGLGNFVLTATPYSRTQGRGVAGQPLSVSFRVIDSQSSQGGPGAFPNPIEGSALTIALPEATQDVVEVEITDMNGNVMYSAVKSSDYERSHILLDGVSESTFKSGVYLIRLKINGKTSNVRLLKN